jgi:hypothetical protein
MDDAIDKTREAIFKVFGKNIAEDERVAEDLIKRHIHQYDRTVRIDAGKLGLPLPCEKPAARRWDEVRGRIGYRVEHLNHETVAVYSEPNLPKFKLA